MVSDILLVELKRVKKAGYTNYRVNAMLTNIRSFFNYAINSLEVEIKNPCSGIEDFPIDIRLKFIPTDDFVDQTACRIGEALRFTDKDIRGKHIVLYTRKSRHSDLVPRIIPRQDVPLKGKGRIFDTWDKRPRFLEEVVEELEQPKWNWHNLRHRRASIWANAGMSLIEIMGRLGQSNIDTTQKYLRLLGFTHF